VARDNTPIQVVWLKRDLRTVDHRPLVEAARCGPVLVLYVYEPSLIYSPEFHAAHLIFINESLAELDRALGSLGGSLVRKVGEIPQVFAALHREQPIHAIWSHQETGSDLTYSRDKRLAVWCRENAVPWTEFPQNGVKRCLHNRNGWATGWARRMSETALEAPHAMTFVHSIRSDGKITPADFELAEPLGKPGAQRGGETAAWHTLDDFLTVRGVAYRKAMSSPVSAWESCSRLSPHLAWGTISLRAVWQQTVARIGEMRASGAAVDPRWFGSLRSFEGRLRWHCHFMQKLEDEPAIEFRNFSRACDGLREESMNTERFSAWQRGETGYPMVDACMRAVLATGWINFRMRAMLASFSAYHLWQHWREPAVFLGRHFLDFEPGIHFSQFQMQSGTTGINTIRIYSPIKQATDQDPDGIFIRQWIPELARVPVCWLAEPHKIPPLLQKEIGCVIGRDYPAPVVDHLTAYREAKQRIHLARGGDLARTEAWRIQEKHGSRKSGLQQEKKRQQKVKAQSERVQGELF